MRLLILALIAFICGSLGDRLAGANRMGCIGSIVLGFVGALIGEWISHLLGIPDFFYLKDIPLLWSIIGAAIFISILHFFTGGRSKR